MRVFLDTNILLDVLQNRREFVGESEAVMRRCRTLQASVWIAWHGLATAYYVLRCHCTEPEALAGVDKMLAWARAATVANDDAHRARRLGFGDFEDALQAVAADACGADWIVTRNAADFTSSPVAAITPAEFLVRVPAP